MLVAKLEKGTDGETILKLTGRLDASSAIHIGTLLEEIVDNGRTHLTIDFSSVTEFDYMGIALVVWALDFYERDFTELMCSGLPENIDNVFKGFGVVDYNALKHCVYRDPKILAVSSS